jgi:hypothetical protein
LSVIREALRAGSKRQRSLAHELLVEAAALVEHGLVARTSLDARACLGDEFDAGLDRADVRAHGSTSSSRSRSIDQGAPGSAAQVQQLGRRFAWT